MKDDFRSEISSEALEQDMKSELWVLRTEIVTNLDEKMQSFFSVVERIGSEVFS